MIFVKKFWSHLNYHNITHDMPYLVFKTIIFSILPQQTFACSKSINRRKFEICSQLTILTLEWRHCHRSSGFILNLEQFSPFILVLLTLNRYFFVGMDDITNKSLKIKYFLPSNFAITKICVRIRLAKDGTRMDNIKFQLSPSLITD